MGLEAISDIRRSILRIVKRAGEATISDVSDELGVTYEAVRQQMVQMEQRKWVFKRVKRGKVPSVGRPTNVYSLTDTGEHLFGKDYDELAIGLIDAVRSIFGDEGVADVLDSLARERVEAMEEPPHHLPPAARLERLKDIYQIDDPHMEVVDGGSRGPLLIERNCPYLHVASERPEICSVTVSALSQLLGAQVHRVKRFQDGDGHCAFRVCPEVSRASLEAMGDGARRPVEEEV